MGDLKVAETFLDLIFITNLSTGALVDGLAPTCSMVKASDGSVTSLTVVGLGGGTGAYKVTDFSGDASDCFATAWSVAGDYTIHGRFNKFKVGGGRTEDVYGLLAHGTYGLEALDADLGTLLTRLSAARAGYLDSLSGGAVALEATLTAMKGSGWSAETLKAIYDKADAIPTAPTLQAVWTDAKAGYLTGAVALEASVQTVDGLLDVPAEDAAADALMREVVGKKSDTAQTTVGATRSIVAYVKGLLNNVALVKTETDKWTGADVDAESAALNIYSGEQTLFTVTTTKRLEILGAFCSMAGSVPVTSTATITVRAYLTINGVEHKVASNTYVKDTDPNGIIIVDSVFAVTGSFRVSVQSDNASDTGTKIPYQYVARTMEA